MSKEQKFNYLLASLTGKAASAVEGLQYSAEENYDEAIKILQTTFGNREQSVELHMTELLSLEKVKSAQETDELRKLVNKVQVNTLALKSLKVETESFAPMLLTALKRAIPPAVQVKRSNEKQLKHGS